MRPHHLAFLFWVISTPPVLLPAANSSAAQEAGPLDILVVAPHPDDEAIGCGGVMLRAIKEGRCVGVVLITGGDGYPTAAAECLLQAAVDALHIVLFGRYRDDLILSCP